MTQREQELIDVLQQCRYCLDRIKDSEPSDSHRLKAGSLLNKTLERVLATLNHIPHDTRMF